MKNSLLIGVSVIAFYASGVEAASPVTINNSANTDSAAVTGHSLNVTCTSGCSGGGGGTVTANQGTPNAGGASAWPVTNTTATPAGTNIIGKVGIDQTTPGTTNGVQTLSGSTTAVTNATASNLNAQVQGAGANAAATTGNPVLIGGSNGTNTYSLNSDVNGRLNINAQAFNNDASAGVQIQSNNAGLYVTVHPGAQAANAITPAISASSAATSLIAKASAGNYYDAYCQSTAAGRCIVYNQATVPSAGALTASLVLDCMVVPAGGQGAVAYGDIPRRFSAGAVILFSSSSDCNTYTASSTAYIHASVQ